MKTRCFLHQKVCLLTRQRRLLPQWFQLTRLLRRIVPSFRSSTFPYTLPSVLPPSRANYLKTVSPEAVMHRPHFALGDTGANDFVAYAGTRSSSLATVRGEASILMRKAANRNGVGMTKSTTWNLHLSLGIPPSHSPKKMHSLGWKRCRGNLMDSSDSFGTALRISEAKVDRNPRHSVSYRLL